MDEGYVGPVLSVRVLLEAATQAGIRIRGIFMGRGRLKLRLKDVVLQVLKRRESGVATELNGEMVRY